jgi:ketosteroid isomerase-like protein
MHANETLITRFYTAFNVKDATDMGACYHDEATFSDPAFPDLDARGVRGMWSMLCGNAGEDFRGEVSNIKADATTGSAHWDAWYTFGATGRTVHNRIDATFTFKDGLIVSHVDEFDFHTWSRQALGMAGLLLGWTPFLRNKVQATAGKQLTRFLEKQAAAE